MAHTHTVGKCGQITQTTRTSQLLFRLCGVNCRDLCGDTLPGEHFDSCVVYVRLRV